MGEESDLERRALEAARAADVDVEIAAGDLLEGSRGEPKALEEARRRLQDRCDKDPDDEARRALAIVTAALEVGYSGE
ncbi:MAG TPA: hypothetical protein VHK89_01380 [Actinomycetota bacterium]|nr:hypothetical protein [Actinomycetota bacterium]